MSPCVRVTCHCKSFSNNIELSPNSSLPQSHTTCSCSTCRRRTGQLAELPIWSDSSSTTDRKLEQLKHYDTTSDRGSNVRSYFCGTCGSKIATRITQRGKEKVVTISWMLGCLDQMELDGHQLIDIKGHSYLDDTGDGGIAAFWTRVGGKDLLRFKRENEEEMKHLPEQPSQAHSEERLHLHCHCKSFSIFVSRPNPSLPLPRNCYWYRPPKDDNGIPQRYMASWCACDSCRKSSGSCLPAHPYVQIPFTDIHTSPSSTSASYFPFPMTSQSDLIGLTRYNSSPTDDQIARYFCSTCGASVLYFDGNRDFIGTFAAGLVDSKEGALALNWLSWWTGIKGHPNPPIHCAEEGKLRWGSVFDDFMDGWVRWGEERER